MSIRVYNRFNGDEERRNLQAVNRTNPFKRRFQLNGQWWEETSNDKKKRYSITDPNDESGQDFIFITKENTGMRNHYEPKNNNTSEIKVKGNYTLRQLTDLLNNPVTSEEYFTLMGLFQWNLRDHHDDSNCARTYQEFASKLNDIAQAAQRYQNPSILNDLYNQIDNCIGSRLADMKNVYDGTKRGVVWDTNQEISHKKQIDRLLKLRETLRLVQDSGYLIHQIGFDYGDYYVSIYSPSKYTPQNYSTGVSTLPVSGAMTPAMGAMTPAMGPMGSTGVMVPRGIMRPTVRRGGKRTRRANRKSKKTRKASRRS
jgi:hypothetical protein